MISESGAGEIVQVLRILPVLAGYPGLIPSINMAVQNGL